MIKIFTNDRRIFICDKNEEHPMADLVLLLSGNEKKDDLLSLIKSFEENSLVKSLVLRTTDIKKTYTYFSNIYKVMEAAGGIVFNPQGELLMIFRNDKWDLPKGKIEHGETITESALREVNEECGLEKLKIIREAQTTYHTYPYGDQRILKCTYWFIMQCADPENIKPQLEEGITELKWIARAKLPFIASQSYTSIISLLFEEKLID
jgi:ADP-ribose pyrophosphatase YjhB (NUDIX family)